MKKLKKKEKTKEKQKKKIKFESVEDWQINHALEMARLANQFPNHPLFYD